MTTPELSRRGAAAVNSPKVELTPNERFEFADAVHDAEVFEDLPERWQKLILEAEED